MSEYDSILKEKKKYVEPVTKSQVTKKHFPWLKIDIFCIIIILCVSYIVYYQKILSPDKIFTSDMERIMDHYQIIIKNLNLDKLANPSYQLEGTLKFEDIEYNYGILRNQDKIKFDLAKKNQYLFYYLESSKRYIQLSTYTENYIQLQEDSYLNIIQNIKKNFSNYITKDKYIKKFYLDGSIPIVESDLVLKDEDIKELISPSTLNNSYEVLFTFKNHAITNEIINMKIAITNLKTNQRYVITYQDKELTYSDDNKNNWKFTLETNQNDFSLKIYKEEVLYSVLSGIDKENTYQYTYQVIDKIYNVILEIQKEGDSYLYNLTSNIEKDGTTKKRNLEATFHYQKEAILEEDTTTAIQYDSISVEEQERYKLELENMIGYLRQFIQEYQ